MFDRYVDAKLTEFTVKFRKSAFAKPVAPESSLFDWFKVNSSTADDQYTVVNKAMPVLPQASEGQVAEFSSMFVHTLSADGDSVMPVKFDALTVSRM